MAGVIGDPVRHSLSPAIHNAGFRALGLDWLYAAFPVPAGRGAEAVAAMRTLGLEGLSVTMPHKADVMSALDGLSDTARALGAVNTIHRRGTQLVGDNTDGHGFLAALRDDEGIDPAGRRCVVLGAGGAARAVVLALARAGAAEVVVVNRTPSRGRDAAALAGDVGRVGDPAEVAGADMVVNATPLGMAGVGAGALPLDPASLGAGQVVVDLVYHPAETPLLAAARAAGATAVGGVGMLVHQAAAAFRLWTGAEAPVAAMAAAATAALARKGTNPD
ncbi:MAG TPA: shikimate dehydrogenase [Acidimicrobiales bacterium]|nr:shikimate dehydrogenase [Acidimicrobiales bacterium]